MKIFPVIIAVLALTANQKCARRSAASTTCCKGRLEVKGICSNYTVKLLEGRLDTSRLVAAWKDEATGKTYNNVFALGNPCSFPPTINAGDEFYFTPDDAKAQCAVCMAYYPTPPKKLSINVLDKACN